MTLFEVFALLGGVGLFLYGMSIMSVGLKNACGERLKQILEHATSNRVVSVFVGMVVTMLIQSSSATDVMVIGFVNSGLMSLGQAIGVIMGANIGTTITAQITAFKISAYAPLILFIGAIMHLFFKRSITRHIGCIIMGFGMLFQGISLMKATIVPLAETPGFIALVSGLQNPFVTVAFGVLFTAILQSSSSSTVIFQTFAMEGIISYYTAVYLCIGAAIGSVTPNLLASLTANREGKRTALLNLIFNLFRAALLMTLLAIFPALLDMIQNLSPTNVARQIANTHSLFAIISVTVMLPFSNYIVKLSYKLLPIKEEESRVQEERCLKYMTQTDRILPAVALSQARQEISRMGKIARDNLEMAIDCFFNPDANKANTVEETEDTVNYLEHAIISKLVELRSPEMSQAQLNQVYHLTLTVADIERLSDHAENIVEYAQQLQSGRATLPGEALEELAEIATLTMQSIDLCLDIFASGDGSRLAEAEAAEELVDEAQEKLINRHIERMKNFSCDPMGSIIFTDMLNDLERCSDHALNIGAALFATD